MSTDIKTNQAKDATSFAESLGDALRRPLTGFVVLMLSCAVLALYCSRLNEELYQHKNPFYDSLSYNQLLFESMQTSRQQGLVAGWNHVHSTNTTVFLPFAIAATIGPWVEPSRIVPIWIQAAYLFGFLTSVLYYLVNIRDLKSTTALLGCFAFFTTSCIFMEVGGLSDFRADLMLCLSFGASALWFLSAMQRPTVGRFVACGIAVAIGCLSRSTSPIYLVISLAPLAVLFLLPNADRSKRIRGLILTSLIASGLSGWFYILNFDYLHYYYFVWNTDANAKLPLSEAVKHGEFAGRAIGAQALVLMIAWTICLVLFTRHRGIFRAMLDVARDRSLPDWTLLWIGLSPIVFLVARRAGLNPYVSMPAVIGLVLFAILPLLKAFERSGSIRLLAASWGLLAVAIGFAAQRGWERHQPAGFNSMVGQQQVMDEILDDSIANKMADVRFGVSHLTELNSRSLFATVMFDREGVTSQNRKLVYQNMGLQIDESLSIAAAANWDEVSGETESEKLQTLLEHCENTCDYVVVPDEKTAAHIQQHCAFNIINRYAAKLRNGIVNGNWERVSGPIQTSENESVEIYRSRRIASQPRVARHSTVQALN
ncbi:glycosyltransferase family 39 protein [Novipirellula caenicola]|uniref:Glycosyltransferase RgtA/B/C/D-like domain-containing protein n=1 Tax=Novipirellula caenicola TaxID=1536901 RepID=A0ABP9VT44_9BACT